MTRANNPQDGHDDADNRLATLLRMLDERPAAVFDEECQELLGHLSDEDRRELLAARQCLDLLRRARPQQELETGNRASSTVGPADFERKSAVPPQQPLRSQFIGRYEILDQLGNGGFGVVFRARDPLLDRLVALKLPRPECLVSKSSQQRFLREARAAACLSHPGIVPIFECGQAGAVTFIAYQLCHGQTLQQWLNDHPPPCDPRRTCEIMLQLAQAVQHAHARGVIHRDLKPGNVMLDQEDVNDPKNSGTPLTVRITDFGLAQLESVDGQSLTQTGSPLGTPAYMSPEQARGETRLTAASDIFSLGVICYRMLTGKVPFQKEHHVATLQAIVNDEPASPRRLNPTLDRDVAAICMRCLEKEPHRRYATCQALEDDLSSYLDGRPIQARELTGAEKTWRWARRNRALAVIGGLLAVSLLLGSGISLYYAWSAERAQTELSRQKTLVDAKAAEALEQARLARTAVNDLQQAVANEPRIHEKGMQSFRRHLLDSARNYFVTISATVPDDDDVLREYLATLDQLAGLCADLGDLDEAASIWSQVIQTTESRIPEEADRLIPVRNRLAESLTNAGRHDEAVAVAARNVNGLRAETSAGRDDLQGVPLIESLRVLANSQSRAGDNLAAANSLDQAVTALLAWLGCSLADVPADKTAARVFQSKADVALLLRDHQTVEQFAPLAIEVFERLKNSGEIDESSRLISLSVLHDLLGTSYAIQNKYNLALASFDLESDCVEQLIALQPELASNAARVAQLLHRRVKTLYESGSVDEAQTLLLAEIPKLDALRSQFPELELLAEKSVLCYQLLAKTFRRQGDLDRATTELDRAIELCEPLVATGQPSMTVQNHLASLFLEKATFLLQQHRFHEGAAECQQALELLLPLYQHQPVGEIGGMTEFAMALAGNLFLRAELYADYLELSEPVASWPSESRSIDDAKMHRVKAFALLQQWDAAEQELAILLESVTAKQSLVNLTGCIFRVAGIYRDAVDDESPVFDRLLESGRFVFDKLEQENLLQDSDVRELIQTHDDFEVLREQEWFQNRMGR